MFLLYRNNNKCGKMSRKIIFFVILMFFCLVSLNTTSAYSAYINIYIVDLDTNTASESDPIKLVDNANSAIQWKLAGTGCSPTGYTNDIANGEYGDGDTITTGSAATLTEGSSCTLYFQVNEVKIATRYWGRCAATNAGGTECTTCANVAAACPNYYYDPYGNGYTSYRRTSHSASGQTGNCDTLENFGRCSDEIQSQIGNAATTEFSWGFTA